MSIWWFWGKLFFLEIDIFFVIPFFDKERIFSTFWQTYLAWISQLNPTCPCEHFEEKQCFDMFAFLSFFGQWANIFDPLAKFSNMVVKSTFNVSEETLWVKLFFLWTKSISVFMMLGHWTNLFRPHGKKFLGFRQNFSGGVVKVAFYLSWRKDWGKFLSRRFLWLFPAIRREIFRHLTNVFGRSFQNCIIRVQRIFLRREKFRFLINFSSVSDIEENFFGLSLKESSTWLSKTLFKCPERHFEEIFSE